MVKKARKKLNLYSNLANTAQTKKDARLKKRAKYLASLPKSPIKRLFFHLHPKRVFKYLFSKDGLLAMAKVFGVMAIIGLVLIGGAFFYFRKDLDNLKPGEISRRVYTTVNTYTDRNDIVLWEDKGDGDYTLAVKSEDIAKVMKDATIAIEDKEFYNHKGISISGIARAIFNNISGRSTQGGSTLTQQLVKQVFFADESQKRGIDGIPRKIKEVILATEIERLYKKDQIITMYLNESPYGGRRNGVESGAQTYFSKAAKDLTLPEAALLAAIPNQPYLYNPYNIDGNDALIARQHRVLDDMVKTGSINKAQAAEAKKVAVLDTIKREASSYETMKAPHFVLEAKRALEAQLGIKTVGNGGLTVKTTVDYNLQVAAEQAVAAGAVLTKNTGADNMALSSVDVDTGQVIAMVGSIDFLKPGYGERNAATSNLEPGSSIKPVIDYAPLFMQRDGINYGPGSILRDENIDKIYCGGSFAGCTLQNYTRQTYGNVTIRQSLGSSLNRPAVKALYIVGPEKALQTARALGDKSYCVGAEIYLSAAIGGGCAVKQVEHTNAYASFARYGSYKPISYILEVKNSSNEQLMAWKDEKPILAVDPQVAYLIADILTDPQARSLTFGSLANSFGLEVPGVWTAGKTGTTENGNGKAKDSWMMGFSTKIATGVWAGNHDGAPLSSSDNAPVRRAFNDYMVKAHQIYAEQAKWKSGDQMKQPDGIKSMVVAGKTDLWPSWFNPKAGYTSDKLVFDKVSKKLATDCTPEEAKVSVDVSKTTDPITKSEIFIAPSDYDPKNNDDVHSCSDTRPSIGNLSLDSDKTTMTISLSKGTYPLSSVSVTVDGKSVYNGAVSSNSVTFKYQISDKKQTIVVNLTDQVMYQNTRSFDGPSNNESAGSKPNRG